MIRELTPQDTLAVRKLRAEGLRLFPDAFGEAYEEWLATPVDELEQRLRETAASPHRFMLGAFDEAGKLVGMCGFVRNERVKTRHKAFIWGMIVLPETQGQGYGAQLLDEAIRRARQMEGLEVVLLHVAEGNVPATKLYESRGFAQITREPRNLKVEGRDVTLCQMMLLLEEGA
jgi:ribosomal protein S18 acetylase RimI-like enzyme